MDFPENQYRTFIDYLVPIYKDEIKKTSLDSQFIQTLEIIDKKYMVTFSLDCKGSIEDFKNLIINISSKINPQRLQELTNGLFQYRTTFNHVTKLKGIGEC